GYNYTLKIDSIWADDGVTLPPEEREAATGVVVEKSRLRGSGRDVIKLTPGTDGTALLHNEIFDSGQRFAGNAECVDNVNSSEMLMIGNHLHDCATNGVYAKGGARNVRIERNLVRDTGAAGIVLGYDDTDVEWFSTETNPEYFENLQGSVTNNFVMNTAHAGIALWGALDPTVAHNTLVGVATSAQEGIFMWRGGPCVPEGDSCTYRRNPVTNAVIVNNLVLMGAGERGALGSREEGVAEDTLINHNHYQDSEGNLSFRWLGAKKNT